MTAPNGRTWTAIVGEYEDELESLRRQLREARARHPVSPSVASDAAPAGELPELAGEWALMLPFGNVLAVTNCGSREEAEEHQPQNPGTVVVRLAVVEAIEPEAPDSFEEIAWGAIEFAEACAKQGSDKAVLLEGMRESRKRMNALARRARLLEGE